MEFRPENSDEAKLFWRPFDQPFVSDWIFWLFLVVGVVLPVASRLNQSSVLSESFDLVSGSIDAALIVVVNYVLFAVVPSSIRRRVRARRQR